MPAHLVTFSQRYKRETHPVLGFMPQLADGYGIVIAPDYRRALDLIRDAVGNSWESMHIDIPKHRKRYPSGELFTVRRVDGEPQLVKHAMKETL